MPVVREAVWTPPVTWANNTPLDEDTLNEQVRNNLLFLKSGHLNIATSYPSSDITTTSGTLASTGLSISLTLEAEADLFLGFSIPYEHTNGAGLITFDWFTTVGNVYVSSGTGTAAPTGFAQLRSVTAAGGRLWSGVVNLGRFAAGNYPYTLRWATNTGTAKIPRSQHPVQLWMLGL